MTKFAMTGAAGYVAPKHLQAIDNVGGKLVVALDRSDSVGILDRYFPDAKFFTQPERFDRYIDSQRREGNTLDYMSICAPNNLHDPHIRMGLRNRMHVICEKPLVLNPKNLIGISDMEKEYDRKVNVILQLRLHDTILGIKDHVESLPKKHFKVDLTYITYRGEWYDYSWKGDVKKSGGLAMNIGIHFFDMLLWIFGEAKGIYTIENTQHTVSGVLELENATVNWYLSNKLDRLPKDCTKRMYRSLKIDGKECEFSKGFEDLHKFSYQKILAGEGFSISDAEPSLTLLNTL